jgi:hypothetical protein
VLIFSNNLLHTNYSNWILSPEKNLYCLPLCISKYWRSRLKANTININSKWTPRRRFLFENLVATLLFKKLLTFIKPKGYFFRRQHFTIPNLIQFKTSESPCLRFRLPLCFLLDLDPYIVFSLHGFKLDFFM